MVLANLAAIAFTIALPYTPLGPLLELVPLPPLILLAVALISGMYVVAAEVGKQIFYRRYK
jgi:hypothetical protein